MNLNDQLPVIKRGVSVLVTEEELKAKLTNKKKLRVKLGVDPTAPDIHLGFTVVLRKLKQFQDLGHQAVLIIGDYTAMLGDPSGRSAARPQLTHGQVMKHACTYQEQLFKVLNRKKTEVYYNGEWFSKMTFHEVITMISGTTVARMLEHDYFAERYRNGNPLGLHEFVYPVMQAFDSIKVRADVELGATDQTFNVLMGRDFQKSAGMEPQVGIFMPVLIGLDGRMKMSKSLGNYVGIDEPPSEMFGKLMSIPDELLTSYFELLTDFPMDELKKLNDSGINPRDLKKRLAGIIVAMYHGEKKSVKAKKEFERIFQRRELPEDLETAKISPEELKDGKIWVVKLLVLTKLADSKAQAQRLICQGAVEINGKRTDSPDTDVDLPAGGLVLKVGKKKFRRVMV